MDKSDTGITYDIKQIAGTVILYNSESSVCDNIRTYISQIDKLYVIDNSEYINSELIEQLQKFPTVKYISNNGNKGIAYALNLAAKFAISDRYKYLLTMDDDSQLPYNAIDVMLNYLINSPHSKYVGIVSGVHSENLIANTLFRNVLYTMTSGNLLILSVYQKVGPFRNDFFIDHVDHEYGFRLNSSGFKVIELPTLLINHRLGRRTNIGIVRKTYISHSPIRSYYIVRNGLIVASLYNKLFPVVRWRVIEWVSKEWLKAILFEDQKLQRLRLLWKGTTDAFHKRLGKLKETS